VLEEEGEEDGKCEEKEDSTARQGLNSSRKSSIRVEERPATKKKIVRQKEERNDVYDSHPTKTAAWGWGP